ncbi:MAG: diacylglycerol kinase family protein [Candidatus Magasanikbacteria bacterium]
MNLKRLIQSFKDAGRGVSYVFKHEQNFRIQLIMGFLVIGLALWLEVGRAELVLLLLLIFSVIGLELINSAVEKFADVLKPRLSFQIEIVKDIMAAVVLLASLVSIIIGVIIFWPYLFALIS